MGVPKKTYVLLIIALALTTCLLYLNKIQETALPAGLRLSEFPTVLAEWTGISLPYPDWLPGELRANEFFIREYRNARSSVVTLYVAYFDARYGGTTHSPDICYPAQGWSIVARTLETVPVATGTLKVTRMIIQKGLEKELVLFYYQIGDQTMPELAQYRLSALVRGILFNRVGGTLVRVSAPVNQTVDRTFDEEAEFLKVVSPIVKEYVPA